MHNKTFNQFIFIISLISFQSWAQGLLGTGLELSVSGDMIYDQGLNSGSEAGDKLTMRGAEVLFTSAADHIFNGVLSAAAHDENGETVFELHELYIASSRLIPRSNIRFGQFFLSIGRLNRLHQHDWAFTEAPKVHKVFFDSEGVFDTGLEYTYLFPIDHTLSLTLGVTSGHKYGHSHTSGSKPKAPTHYTRLSSFFPFSTTNGIELGLNYLGRTDAQNNQMQILGLDITAKKRQGRVIKHLFQSELWYKNEKNKNNEEAGLYVFNDFAIGLQTTLGFRLDAYKSFSKINPLTNKKNNNISYGGVIQATHRASEFTNVRASLSHNFDREEGHTTFKDLRATLQFVFILGSHPAHEF